MMSVTVGVISCNRPEHLRASLRTIASQTVAPDEVIIADCSDNLTEIQDVVIEFEKISGIQCQLKWRRKDQITRSQGRQLSLGTAASPILISTECDILWPTDIVEESMKYFQQRKKIYVQPWIAAYGSDGKLSPVIKNHRCGFYQMFWRKDFEAIGGYNPLLTAGWGFEDADLKERMIAYGCSVAIVETVVKHQYHQKSASNDTNTTNQKIARNSYFDQTTKTWKMRCP